MFYIPLKDTVRFPLFKLFHKSFAFEDIELGSGLLSNL
jgi:hypothetical protein